MVKNYLADVRCVPFVLKGVHDSHVEWSVVAMKLGDRHNPLTKPTTT